MPSTSYEALLFLGLSHEDYDYLCELAKRRNMADDVFAEMVLQSFLRIQRQKDQAKAKPPGGPAR